MPDLLPSPFPFHGRNKCQPGNLMSARKAREEIHSSRISSQPSPKHPRLQKLAAGAPKHFHCGGKTWA